MTAPTQARFEHRYPGTDVTFGRGAAGALAPILEQLHVERALLVCGPRLAENVDLVQRVVDGAGGRIPSTFAGIGPHAPLPDVDAAYARFVELGCDGVVSLGGGSSHDAAAAVALAAHRRQTVGELVAQADGVVRLDDARDTAAPSVAVPTTLSAAETTCGAGVTDVARGRKCTLFGRALFASHVVLDPDVFATTPLPVLLGTGMNAVNHAVERLCSPALQPLAEPPLVAATRLLVRALPRLATEPEALADAIVGAHMSTSTTVLGGLAHALTHQLGSRYRVDHGILSGIVLPPCVEFVRPAVPDAVARLAELLGADPPRFLRGLVGELDLPARLRDVEVPRDELPLVAEHVLAGFSIRHSARPVAGRDELVALLESCW